MNRREILKRAAALAAWSGFWTTSVSGADRRPGGAADEGDAEPRDPADHFETRKGDMLYRPLGRTGERVSVIGVGGHHLGRMESEEDAIRFVRTAIDRGVNFMDNCWAYHGGKSEVWMGKALKDGYRDKVFLMTKFEGRTKQMAAKHIDESLKRLDVDHVDLMQIHEVLRLEDPDRCFREDGAIEALREAQKAGKIRYVGFTGHKDPLVHNRMLDVAAEHNFRFDTVQMPINPLDATFRSFARHTLPRLVEAGIGAIGMKSSASGEIIRNGIATPQECLRYALTLPTSTVVVGMESMDLLEQTLAIVRDFKPLSGGEMTALLTRTAPAARTGRYEGFKTTTRFDATTHNPQWMG
ncbi:MAG TPA: aldo/keto reductase [Phycisphaerae bacterium]|nr:aldo/keto reductase [Phycisphaerae bacterium]HOJ75503.1 aldo/keto reductase [Phycisphaerae bacterium]HOM52861.1 aldo/keto reductase [Phycisphaerae bacterium]HON65605.1 aldo/keto reductase [Phycisphaerae bacterium]HOQ86886.1 aldo/keto reductase [Phycisphaerae bacterium]